MPQTAAQLVSDACLEAKTPGYLSFAGRKFNMILAELCSYDIDVIRGTFQFNFQPGIPDPLNIGSTGSGPYPLPLDWNRSNRGDVFYIILGVKYEMTPIDISEWDALVSQGGLNAFPEFFSVDNSPINSQMNPLMYVWPPPSGSFPVTARYFRQMPDIDTPETSALIPWFPNQLYLNRRLVGEMMLYSGDDRAQMYLNGSKNSFLGASEILRRWLQTQGADQVVKTIELDKRRFGPRFINLRNTKTIGWHITALLFTASSLLQILHHVLGA